MNIFGQVKTVMMCLTLGIAVITNAQTLSGTVTDSEGDSLIGVNVYLKGTYDGATTDINGFYSFETSLRGSQILITSLVGFKLVEIPVELGSDQKIDMVMKEDVSRLSGVTITAGSFEASDEKKSVILKPLDIAMTAGATADITGALTTLPGTSTNGESGRLFVRGGTAEETQAFVDGVLVPNFYTATPNGIPARSRFSPFLFKGTFFSTGGYSAEFGQALSSVISLTSNDLPTETRTDISLMTVGADVAHTQKWENGSIYGQVQRTDLDPYNSLIKQEFDWEIGPRSTAGTFMLRQKIKGPNMLKVYANLDHSNMILKYPSINSPAPDHIDLTNKNLYVNTNYRHAIGKKSAAYVGMSHGETSEQILLNDLQVKDQKENSHIKSYFSTDISQVSLKMGGELITADHQENVVLSDGTPNLSEYSNTIAAGFIESDYYITNSLTLRSGLRYSNYSLFGESLLSPRISMAYRTSQRGQLSAAFGKFHQLPASDLLIRSSQVNYESADHYMISYQQLLEGRTLRAEVYHKEYDRLVKFNPQDEFNPFTYSNSGEGYAQGVDLFYRDSKTLKNIDFWVTYSFLNTERDHQDFPYLAPTDFSAKHNFSVVYKQFFTKLKTQIGAAFRYNSGRPYNDPNESIFNGSTTKDFADLSFNLAYLPRQNVIIYASATNLLGRNNVFGYEFENEPGTDNYFDSRAIGQPAKHFLFLGVFITLTKDKTKNNLENI